MVFPAVEHSCHLRRQPAGMIATMKESIGARKSENKREKTGTSVSTGSEGEEKRGEQGTVGE